tara:strand:+ start:842 stop:1024 length:183 start_codon:yes stop_codon:yes gene_type:complete
MVKYIIDIDNRSFKEVVLNFRSDEVFKRIVKENWSDLKNYNYTITVIENDQAELLTLEEE